MKDAKGHGSDSKGGLSVAHQAGINQLQPSLAEGRELYARLSAHAESLPNQEHSGFSPQDEIGYAGREQGGGEYDQYTTARAGGEYGRRRA